MKTLEFKTKIAASPERVWNTMIGPETYRQWVNVSWPESFYVGEWEEGKKIIFTGPGGGGTQAQVMQIRPYELIDTEHIAVVKEDGTLDKESDMAKDWIGSKETYHFNKTTDGTELVVKIKTAPDWEQEFNRGWPGALQKLKELSEQ